MNDWAGVSLGHAPATDDGLWHGRPRPEDEHYLTEPVVVPKVQRSTRAVTGLLLVAAIVYGGFVLAPWRHGDWVPYIALVVAEVILLGNALAMWWTGLFGDDELWGSPEVHAFRHDLLSGASTPTVDVIITVYGEPLDVITRTVRAARAMRLAHDVYVCDDGRSDDIRDLCTHLGVGYLRRDDRRGVKAGNANRALARTHGDHVAIFDADHAAHPDFLVVALPHLARPEVAFVQCSQAYRTDKELWTGTLRTLGRVREDIHSDPPLGVAFERGGAITLVAVNGTPDPQSVVFRSADGSTVGQLALDPFSSGTVPG